MEGVQWEAGSVFRRPAKPRFSLLSLSKDWEVKLRVAVASYMALNLTDPKPKI